MPVYAVGITPLLQFILTADTDLRHVAFADDLGGAGKFQELRSWWQKIIEYGPKLGYYPKASKSWLVVKTKEQLDLARAAFDGTNLNITCEGRKYLGGFVGSAEGKTEFMKETVREWCDEVRLLAQIAKSEPQAAYTAFVGGYKHKLTYKIRTTDGLESHLQQLDHVIDSVFIPAVSSLILLHKNMPTQLKSLPS